jgi:hypothetical protein
VLAVGCWLLAAGMCACIDATLLMDNSLNSLRKERGALKPDCNLHSESQVSIIANILKEITAQFHAGNISQDQRVSFKERALDCDCSHIDLHVLLTEVKVYEECPEVCESSISGIFIH